MSDAPFDGEAPVSQRLAIGLNGQFEASSQVNAYRDDAGLDRVWKRLESRRRRSSGPTPLLQMVAAAALVSAGIFVGMGIERTRLGDPVAQFVSSEVIVAQRAPTGRVTESPVQLPGPERIKKLEVKVDKKRPRRRARRHSRLQPEEGIVDAPEELVAQAEIEIVEVVEELPPPQPQWLLLADRGEYAAAFQQLDEAGGFDSVLTNGSSEELMALADVARFVGRQGRAIQALRAVTERFQGDANAPLAAMIIGNLLSRAGDAQGAASAYALNRRLSPSGDFAEDALVREFDMAMADGDLARVGSLRGQYESEFPEGRHLSDMQAEEARLLEAKELEGESRDRHSKPAPEAESATSKGAEGEADDESQETSKPASESAPQKPSDSP